MKTIYLLNTKAYGANSVPLAFECEHCAQTQAAWFRRSHVQADVVAIRLHEHMRTAIRDKDPHVKMGAPGKATKSENQCGHAPQEIQG
jgi:glutaredoxin